MNTKLTRADLESRLAAMLELPHNRVSCAGMTSSEKARQILDEVATAFVGLPRAEEFVGPQRFLRATGFQNAAFSGSWWFAERTLLEIRGELGRVPLPDGLRQAAIRGRLRSALAVSLDWNPMSELWLLDLPPGERLAGLVGRAKFQPIHSRRDLRHDSERILSGGEEQIYFPVKNPLWVWRYRV